MIFRIIAAIGLLAAFLVAPTAARADWYEASSDHFVIYADDKERDIRRFAENLERYHSAMAYVTGRNFEKPSPSNRVVIFVVGDQRDVRKLAGTDDRALAGFYIPRAGGSLAFVQDIRNKNGYPHFSTIVLLHEYAHHFLISSSRFAMPRWMSEGAAEFFASAGFEKDGSVLVGRPAVHRGAELAYAEEVSIRELLDPEQYEARKGKRYDAFYGRSWLLYHYLTFEKERAGQATNYWLEVLNGTPPIEAGEKVFGDLDTLEKELDAYVRQRRMFTFNLTPEKLSAGEVAIRKLPEGEAEVMPLRMRSQRGVTAEQAAELLVEIRAVAARYPDDAGVLAALSEAEYDAGNDAEAIAAADRAIAIDPARTNPYVQKGYALFRMAADADDRDAAYQRAMQPFTELNGRENNHPLPLIYFYRSFVERGEEPPENARHALERAAQLAPFDKGLWFNVAMMQMGEGKIALAKIALQPIANDPHGGEGSDRAKELIALLGRMEEGTRVSGRDAMLAQGVAQVAVSGDPGEEPEAEEDEGEDEPEQD
ncbi:hypothetical protein [Erythrobacter sp. JK5]|uniref:hypothetical protein n=1 Tax=Erythrobacter sp. JK5 TaxID=2829500 RepID=UPI001BA64032|nr:hypothetical protein [Erythrobacter sp. JK5]QUL36477.1 hypothetical protein KDC96_08435 [Erythrobacter sp. JK5]